MSWETVRTQTVTHDELAALFNNEIAAIRIPHFLAAKTCRLAVEGIYAHGLDYYENVVPRIGRIGITQFEHRKGPAKKVAYFEKAIHAHLDRQAIFKGSGDLLQAVIEYVGQAWGGPASVAIEDGAEQQYFAGLIRVINKALLHLDWAKLDAPDWTIGHISAQLAWNIYLQMGEEGGATVVYRRMWQPSDEQHQVAGSYEYDHSLVSGCDNVAIRAEQGELVLFNSRNYHKVEMTEGAVERITVSSFIGLMPDTNRLIFWS